MTKTSKIIN